MISDNLKSSYNNYLKTAKIEELESLSAFYSNTDPISAESTIIFFDFLRHIAVDSSFRDKWFKLQPSFSNLKDNSEIQQESLFKIVLGILSDNNLEILNQRGKKGQVWYLFANAVASYCSYNQYYFVTQDALEILNKNININKPTSRSKIFNIRNNGKKMLTFEHMCPATQLIDYMIEAKINFNKGFSKIQFESQVLSLLKSYGTVSIITQEENKRLKGELRNRLNSNIPSSTERLLERYEKANIKITDNLIPVFGKMYR